MGGGRAGRGCADVAGERADVGASTAGDRGREVENELTGGVGKTEIEAGTRARGRRQQACPTGQRERGGRERARWLALTGGARLSGTEGTRAQAHACGVGLSGSVWAEIGFPFFQGFSNCFSIYFL
jgi:hypothetical protein